VGERAAPGGAAVSERAGPGPVSALVTGGGGFLGRAIVEQLLAEGARVRVFSRRRFPELEALGAESAAGDLADADAVRRACAGVEVVFHVAAVAGAWGPRATFERTNVLGTEHVIAACQAERVPRLVFTSSPSVISGEGDGAGADHAGVDERVPYPTRFLADYPRTKAAAERAVLAANGGALRTCALRPHLIVGPGDPHLLPRVIARARAGRLRVVGDGANRVDLTAVEDAARAHLLAARALEDGGPAAGRAYFISQDEPVALWPWIEALLERLELPGPRGRVSLGTARAAGALLEGLWRLLRLGGEPPMTRFVATQLATSHWFDISAAKRDLGYAPARSMAEVTDALVAHYRDGAGRAALGR